MARTQAFLHENNNQTPAFENRSDPWVWSIAISFAFACLALIGLTIPSAPYFDEVHYLPAARELLFLWEGGVGEYKNTEHPLLGKILIAAGMAAFGDNPFGWRIAPLLAGSFAIFAGMRAIWQASLDRYATITFGLLLASGFHLFVHSRIAMLDIFMIAFLALAFWQFAASIREPETARARLLIAGIALGFALGSKWNAAPLAMAPGLVFFASRLSAGRRRLILSTRGTPIPGISLAEAFVWLGIVPLAAYALTFVPGYFMGTALRPSPLAAEGLIGFHAKIIELQQSVMAPHVYSSTWDQWVLNARAIWYFYEFADNAQRGVLLIGNPLTMLIGLPALVWCLVAGLVRGDWARLSMAIGYALALGLWLIAPKPVQFYYHYMAPHMFLLGALALALSDLRGTPKLGWLSAAVPAGSLILFAGFYPVLAARPLDGPMSFLTWAWFDGWR